MLVQFHDIVSASIYASSKIEEGYFAELIHLNAGYLYGQNSAMGFAVIVSEYAAEDGEEVPEGEISSSLFVTVVGWGLWYFTWAVFIYNLGSFLLGLLIMLFQSPLQVFIFVLTLFVVFLLLKYLTILYGLALGRMVSFLRKDEMFAKLIKLVLCVLLALIMIVI